MTNITMKPEDLQAMIAAAVATAVAAAKPPAKAKGGKPGRKPMSEDEKAAARAKTDATTVKNFKAAGYGIVTPRVDVMTYNRWMAAGRIVRKGEKSIKCGSFALFHISQTDVLAPEAAPAPEAVKDTVH